MTGPQFIAGDQRASASDALSWPARAVGVDGGRKPVAVACAAAEWRTQVACTIAALAAVAVAVTMMGCGSTPPATPEARPKSASPAPADPHAGSPLSAYEQRLRERASSALRQRRLADAALAWELLTVLRPSSGEYRARLAETQAQIDAAVAERLPRAALAAQRGELETATQAYLAILARQPSNEAAADALRALERERNKRAFLGKLSRHTLTQRAIADAEMATTTSALAERNELEHAALLAGDGEIDDAIALLERQVASDRRDGEARRSLADLYQRKAEMLLPRDRPGAIATLQKSVRADPSLAIAWARLRQLQAKPVGASAPEAAASAAAVPKTPARPARSAAKAADL